MKNLNKKSLLSLCGGCLLGFAGAVEVSAIEYEIYLIGGQSNIEGMGRNSFLTTGQRNQSDVQMYHDGSVGSGANQDKWTNLKPAGTRGGFSFGPEVSFGERMNELRPDANIAVIKSARGGTSLAVDWKPGVVKKDGGGRPTRKVADPAGPDYRRFALTVYAALAKLDAAGHTYVIKGMLWQQGEEDSKFADKSGAYAENLGAFIGRVRDEFESPNMQFVYGNVLPDAVGSHATDISGRFPYRDVVRQAHLDVDQDSGHADATDGAHIVLTNNFATHGGVRDGHRDNDYVHFSESGLLDLGNAFADKMYAVTVPEPASGLLMVLGGMLFMKRKN